MNTVTYQESCQDLACKIVKSLLAEINPVYFQEDLTFHVQEVDSQILITINEDPYFSLWPDESVTKEDLEYAIVNYHLAKHKSIPFIWDSLIFWQPWDTTKGDSVLGFQGRVIEPVIVQSAQYWSPLRIVNPNSSDVMFGYLGGHPVFKLLPGVIVEKKPITVESLQEDLLKESEEGTRLAQKYVGWVVKSIADSVVTLVSPDGSETVTIEPASEYLEIGGYLV